MYIAEKITSRGSVNACESLTKGISVTTLEIVKYVSVTFEKSSRLEVVTLGTLSCRRGESWLSGLLQITHHSSSDLWPYRAGTLAVLSVSPFLWIIFQYCFWMYCHRWTKPPMWSWTHKDYCWRLIIHVLINTLDSGCVVLRYSFNLHVSIHRCVNAEECQRLVILPCSFDLNLC